MKKKTDVNINKKRIPAAIAALILCVSLLHVNAFADNGIPPLPGHAESNDQGPEKPVPSLTLNTDGQVSQWKLGEAKAIQGVLKTNKEGIGGAELTITMGNQAPVTVRTSEKNYSRGHYLYDITPESTGEQTIEVSFAGNDDYGPVSVTQTVNVADADKTQLILEPVQDISPEQLPVFKGKLLDKDGNGIAGQDINVSCSTFGAIFSPGFVYPYVVTAQDGSFSCTPEWSGGMGILKPGEYTFSMHYSGTETYTNASAQGSFNVVNSVSVCAALIWDDAGDQDGRRPKEVGLKIRRIDEKPVTDADGEVVPTTMTVQGTGDAARNDVEWSNLQKIDMKTGGLIGYEVVECDSDGNVWTPTGYTKTHSGSAEEGFVITNRHAPRKTDINVKIEWNETDILPDGAELYLDSSVNDETTENVRPAAEAKADSWSVSFKDLPYYKNGVAIEYIIRTNRNLRGCSFSEPVKEDKAGLKSAIIWNEGSERRGLEAKWQYNGDYIGYTYELNEDNEWTLEWKELRTEQAEDKNEKYTLYVLLPENNLDELALPFLQQTTVVRNYTVTGAYVPPARVSIPGTASFYYTGSEITAYEETEQYTVTGGEGKEKGTYTAEFKLKDGNFVWEDGTDTPKKAEWKIISRPVQPVTYYTVSFYPGEGSGAMASRTVTAGTWITVPEIAFDAPQGKCAGSGAWISGSKTFRAGDRFPVVGNMSLTSVWEEHDWEEPVYSWAEDHSEASAVRSCRICSAQESETVQTKETVKREPDFDREGEKEYTASFENEAFGTQTVSVPVPALPAPEPSKEPDPENSEEPDPEPPAPVKIKLTSVRIRSKSLTYTKKPRTQSKTTVVMAGNRVLRLNTDYSISYKNNLRPGTAVMTIRGKGEYTGKLTAAFKIVPSKRGFKSVKAGKNSIALKWLKKKPETTGYQYEYSCDKNFRDPVRKTVRIKNESGKYITKTVKGLKKGRNYYVRLRAYKAAGGKNYYSEWSSPVKVKI